MNGISSGVEVSDPGAVGVKQDWLSLLKKLEREEIEEVLSEGFCSHCQPALLTRIQSVVNRKLMKNSAMSSSDLSHHSHHMPESSTSSWGSKKTPEIIYSGSSNGKSDKLSPTSADSKRSPSLTQPKSGLLLRDGICESSSKEDDWLSEDQKENIRFANVGKKKNFLHMERINGRQVNVLQGLELYTQVFNAEEQKQIVESVYRFQRLGQKGRLRERTYTEPSKWMRGKGRVTIQFGCCYNYATDKKGNPPGIIRDEEVDPLPPIFINMIKRMVKWHVLPSTCVPNSCIVNIYEEGDCIPPHIDSHDFVRPFCTVSFLTECNILFGTNLKIVGPGEFSGPVTIPLPLGSVLILSGNGADMAKHCIPAVPAKRISITFRRMDERKTPYGHSPEAELQGLRPMASTTPLPKTPIETIQAPSPRIASKITSPSFVVEKNDFPTLGASFNDFPPLGAASNGSRQRDRSKKTRAYS